MARLKAVRNLEREWESDARWNGIVRDYTADDVERLRGSIEIKYTLAEMGAERLWRLLNEEPYVSALGALTGNQAIQQVRAGLKAIHLSGWQVAADANSATLLTSDIDERDHPFLTGERTGEGFFMIRNGVEAAIARALAYAPYADLLWMETSTPDIEEARQFAEAVHAQFPGKMLAYNCSPSFDRAKKLSADEIG